MRIRTQCRECGLPFRARIRPGEAELPCPSCGMTRSWVWLARGQEQQEERSGQVVLDRAEHVTASGLLGLARVVVREPARWKVPMNWISTMVIAWLVGPYLGLWVLRMLGYYPLAS